MHSIPADNMQCMVCSKPVWTSGEAEKRKREAFIPAIIDEASFKSWCDLSRRILDRREQYHGSADMSISAEGMSLERFQKFVMNWLKDTMACKLILCLSEKQTISTPTEFRNRRIIRYHGFAQEHTFRISYEYDVENWFDFFSLVRLLLVNMKLMHESEHLPVCPCACCS
jgi:hypothetical protein